MVAHWRLPNAAAGFTFLPCSLQIAHVALVAVEDEKEQRRGRRRVERRRRRSDGASERRLTVGWSRAAFGNWKRCSSVRPRPPVPQFRDFLAHGGCAVSADRQESGIAPSSPPQSVHPSI